MGPQLLIFKYKLIQGCYRAYLDVSRSYALLISIEFFYFGFLWYSSFVINFPRFLKRCFMLMKILLLRYSQNNYQIWLYKLNLMCEELSYQIINTSAVNQGVFCYYNKTIIKKKTLVLVVASNKEMHFFEFI